MTTQKAIPVYDFMMDPEDEMRLCHEHRMTDPEKLKDVEAITGRSVNIKTIYQDKG